MKVSYAFTLLAGGFLSSGYHTINTEAASLFFLAGVVALLIGAVTSQELGL